MTNEGTEPLRRLEQGFALEGPGFYLWDEDPREVLRAAAELRAGGLPSRPPQRMLVVRPEDGDPEPTTR